MTTAFIIAFRAFFVVVAFKNLCIWYDVIFKGECDAVHTSGSGRWLEGSLQTGLSCAACELAMRSQESPSTDAWRRYILGSYLGSPWCMQHLNVSPVVSFTSCIAVYRTFWRPTYLPSHHVPAIKLGFWGVAKGDGIRQNGNGLGGREFAACIQQPKFQIQWCSPRCVTVSQGCSLETQHVGFLDRCLRDLRDPSKTSKPLGANKKLEYSQGQNDGTQPLV